MSNFYAVLKGRVPGIYTEWSECKKQTDGFLGPVFRKFFSREEAQKFLDPCHKIPSPKKQERKNIRKFVEGAFSTTIKMFRVSGETVCKIADAIWDDLENAEDSPDIFRLVLEEYLPLPDAFLVKSLQTFLDEQTENKSGYGGCIDLLSIAYREDGGKRFQNKTSSSTSVCKVKDILFVDDDGVEYIEESDLNTPVDLTSVLYTDGAHNKSTGSEAWGSVVNKRGEDVMEDYRHAFTDMMTKVEVLPVGTRRIVVSKFNDVATQQVNGAELLALIIGLRLALFSKGSVRTIMCDSKLMTDYWSKYLKEESRDKMDPRKAHYVDELIKLRKEYEKIGGTILKISGDDNKADLGGHIKKR